METTDFTPWVNLTMKQNAHLSQHIYCINYCQKRKTRGSYMSNEELVLKIQRGDDAEQSIEELYQKNRGLIGTMVKHFNGFEDPDDLFQQGFLGLYKAAINYDPEAGASFATFAWLVIRQELRGYIDRHSSLVRLPDYKCNEIRQYNQLVEDSIKSTGKAPEDAIIMRTMKLSPGRLKQLKIDAVMVECDSLDEELTDDFSLKDTIPSGEDIEEDVCNQRLREEIRTLLDEMIMALKPVEQDTVNETILNNHTIRELAKKHGLSQSRVSQIRKEAIRSLQHNKQLSRLKELCDNLYGLDTYTLGISGTSVQSFKRSGSSATERAAIKRLEMDNKIRAWKQRLLDMMEEAQVWLEQHNSGQ